MIAPTDAQRLAFLLQGDAWRLEQASLSKPLAKLKAKHSKATSALEAKALQRTIDVLSADKMIARKAVRAARELVRTNLSAWKHEEPQHSTQAREAGAELLAQLRAHTAAAQIHAKDLCAAAVAAADEQVRERLEVQATLARLAANVAHESAPSRDLMRAHEERLLQVSKSAERRFTYAAEPIRVISLQIQAAAQAARADEQRESQAKQTRLEELQRRQQERAWASTDEQWRSGADGAAARAHSRAALRDVVRKLNALMSSAVREGLAERLRAAEAGLKKQHAALTQLEGRAGAAVGDAISSSGLGAVTQAHEARAEALRQRIRLLQQTKQGLIEIPNRLLLRPPHERNICRASLHNED